MKTKRLYQMNVRELRDEALAAEARGDERRAHECWEQIALTCRVMDNFRKACDAPLSKPEKL